MTRLSRAIGAVALAAAAVAPAQASWRLVEANRPYTVRTAGVVLTPATEWNRETTNIGRRAELWTLDGVNLNRILIFGKIRDGEALFRDDNKRDRPLPRFDDTMLPPDIVQLFEANYRLVLGTSLFQVGEVAPATLGGHPGVRFDYSFADEDELERRGRAHAAVIGGRLYLVAFDAAAIHYYDKSIADFDRMIATARISG